MYKAHLPQYKFQKNQLFKCKNENLKVIKEAVEKFFYNFKKGRASMIFLNTKIF